MLPAPQYHKPADGGRHASDAARTTWSPDDEVVTALSLMALLPNAVLARSPPPPFTPAADAATDAATDAARTGRRIGSQMLAFGNEKPMLLRTSTLAMQVPWRCCGLGRRHITPGGERLPDRYRTGQRTYAGSAWYGPSAS
ncbi:hypothetical protein RJ55_06782 [Drechmeria coniospora]|nr:hypothetical protein RJ55_06782 [Drechmeria coniospora]